MGVFNNTKRTGAVQELLGRPEFTANGIRKGDYEWIFLRVAPSNLSVLSDDAAEDKIRKLTLLLDAQPQLEVLCLDAVENYAENRRFLEGRLREEKDEEVRELLRNDLQFLNDMQLEMSSSRVFYFVIRVRVSNEATASVQMIHTFERTAAGQGLSVRRADRSECMELFARYLDAGKNGFPVAEEDGLL